MKKILLVIFFIFFVNPSISQKVENFDLNPDRQKLEGQFFVGNYTSESPEEAKYKFLKWLTYFNAGEDIHIDEIEEGRIVFTRIFPHGINMRILKGAQYDLLGNSDLGVRFVVEFKDSRYRVLIDRLAYFADEFDAGTPLGATGKWKDYRPYFSEEFILKSFGGYSNPRNLPLEYRNPDEIKKNEKKKLDDLIVLLNSFLDSTAEFENDFYDQPKIVDNSFSLTENNTSFPGQAVRKNYVTNDYQEFTSKAINWFNNNSKELGLKKLYTYKDKMFIFGNRYFNSSSGLLSTFGSLTGAAFGEVHYYYIEIKLNDDSVDFGINKILWANFTSGCGSGLDKALIKMGEHEFIVYKKIYINSDLNTAISLKEFELCPAILMIPEVTNYADLFNKKGKPRKARTKTAEDQLAFYNDIYQNFSRNVFPDETEDEVW